MAKIADELARATDLIQSYAGECWDRTIDRADRDALVWLLEIVGSQHAYIRSQAFREVVAVAYQMGRQDRIAEEPG
jgi:hypothetical protein